LRPLVYYLMPPGKAAGGLGLLPGPLNTNLIQVYCSVSSSLCVVGTFWHVGRAATVVTV
jgi:hypothetical protein